jgi:hypothetical protein
MLNGIKLSVVMLNVIMLSVVKPNAIVLNVMAPSDQKMHLKKGISQSLSKFFSNWLAAIALLLEQSINNHNIG